MKATLDFILKICKLKEKPRRGWVLYGIKNPETTADHLFRSTILGWVLNKQKGLDEEKLLKTLLLHDIFEVYVEDKTPYDSLIPKDLSKKSNGEKIKEILKRKPPFSLREKKKIEERKFQEELKGLEKLILELPPDLKKEIEHLWIDYRRKKTKIGKFAWQIGKLESFLQALEYSKREDKIQLRLWRKWSREVIKDKTLAKFRNIAEIFLCNQNDKKRKKIESPTSGLFWFIKEIEKLKFLQRRGWVFRGVKNAETVAQHTFHMTIMAWLLGLKKGLNIKRVLKIALAHDLCEVYAGDQTPYDPILLTNNEPIKEIVKKPPRIPHLKRLEWLIKKRATEWRAITKLTSHLPQNLQEEIINLWVDFEEGTSKEGRFVSQVDKIANLVQAIEYHKKDKNFPIIPWWIGIKERIDDPLLLKFIDELDRYFSK
ncbi:MAG: HD domain-containing protein [Candidatus Pacebacteria bacterium]|nr:HD domain-containing protein [Candidatus Paceibacterota bacterium]